MIGILRLPSKYYIILDTKQLRTFLNIIANKPGSVQGKILLIDAMLQINPRSTTSKSICYLIMMARKLSLSILFIADEETKIDRRIEIMQTEKIKLTSKLV